MERRNPLHSAFLGFTRVLTRIGRIVAHGGSIRVSCRRIGDGQGTTARIVKLEPQADAIENWEWKNWT
jgi:ABC-type tungstate transport system substrate-binding protein